VKGLTLKYSRILYWIKTILVKRRERRERERGGRERDRERERGRGIFYKHIITEIRF
jgi:hypothetical protein